jgi:hypothetical protein
MPEAGWPPVGMYGFKELPTGAKAEKKMMPKSESPQREETTETDS